MMKPSPAEAAFFGLTGLIWVILSSCDLYSSQRELQVEIPPAPPGWEGIPMKGTLSSGLGAAVNISAEPGSVISLRWPKGVAGLLIYYPYAGNRALKPAGVVFTAAEGGRLQLSWTEGWLAEALKEAISTSGTTPQLNWVRIKELYSQELQGRSPWLLDRKHFSECLHRGYWGSGTFRISVVEGLLQIPPGTWRPDDPAQPVLTGPGMIMMPLREGTNLWYGDKETLAICPLPEGGQDWGVFSTLSEPSEPAM